MGNKATTIVVLLSALSTGVAVRSADSPAEERSAPLMVRKALGCLVTADYVQHDLDQLGLKPDSSAWIRFHVGSIPGSEPTPGEYYIAVYTEDESRGWLLLTFRDDKGPFIPVRNGYQLKREGTRWTADEGNGGLATYKTMSAFATRLYKYHRYRVKLTPGTCNVSEERNAF